MLVLGGLSSRRVFPNFSQNNSRSFFNLPDFAVCVFFFQLCEPGIFASEKDFTNCLRTPPYLEKKRAKFPIAGNSGKKALREEGPLEGLLGVKSVWGVVQRFRINAYQVYRYMSSFRFVRHVFAVDKRCFPEGRNNP